MNIKVEDIKRGEIWLVDFDPTKGDEIKKKRPAVVISSDTVGKLALKVVVPLTGWQKSFELNHWITKLDPDAINHLDKPSAVDGLQLRSVSVQRFVEKKGRVTAEQLDEIAISILIVIDY